MKRIKIGNSIAISWAIFDLDGTSHSFADKDLSLFLTSGGQREDIRSFTIEDNVISFAFPAIDQHSVGIYKLNLIETNITDSTQRCWEVCEAFQLVSDTITAACCVSEPTNIYVRSILTGSKLMGVESIDVVSTGEDGGTNVVTLHLTNGQFASIPIRNGSKGERGAKGDKGDTGAQGRQGAQGERGPVGVERVTASVVADDVPGIPDVAVSFAAGVLNFVFSHLKGPRGERGYKGDSGYQGDFSDFEVVNSLDSDDDEAALSAFMGKVLASGFQFKGIANRTTTEPEVNPILGQYYIAGEPGVYGYFNDVSVADNEVAIIYFNPSDNTNVWHKAVLPGVTQTDLLRKVTPFTLTKAPSAFAAGDSLETILSGNTVLSLVNTCKMVKYGDDYYLVSGAFEDSSATSGTLQFVGTNIVTVVTFADHQVASAVSHNIFADAALSGTSENAVQNKVVKTAMDSLDAAKQNVLTFDNVPTAGSNNPITSGGAKTALDAKQDNLVGGDGIILGNGMVKSGTFGYGTQTDAIRQINQDDEINEPVAHATGEGAIALGSGTAEGYRSIAGGFGADAEGDGSIALGEDTYAHGDDSVAFGKGTESLNAYEVAMGAYNASSESEGEETTFTVGIGESDEHRANALEIRKSGKTYIKGVGGYNGTNPQPGTNDVQSVLSTFITNSVNNLVNYYLKSETYTKSEVQTLISAVSQFRYELVNSLPTASAETMGVIYLVPSSAQLPNNIKDEYITIESGGVYSWEQIGSTEIDPSNYVTTTALNTALADYTTTSALTLLLAAKQDVLTFDDAPTENSNNPVKSGGVKAALDAKANIDGQYDTLTSGYAGNLIDKSDAGSEQQIMFRKTGGTTEVSASTRAMFKRLLGRTLVWNQLIQNPDFSDGTNHFSTLRCSISINDSVLSVTPDGTGNPFVYQDGVFALNVTHKYLYIARVRPSADMSFLFSNFLHDYGSKWCNANEWTTLHKIIEINAENSNGTRACITSNNRNDTFEVDYFNVIDLTLMYGAGYEPATVAEFESVYKKPYYPHCTAAFIHNVVQTYEAIGQNQWDEEWRNGYYDSNGEFIGYDRFVANTNPVRIVPNASYYIKKPQTAVVYIYYYDANGDYLGSQAIGGDGNLSIPSEAALLNFRLDVSYGTTYNHDVCINLSNADINGTYAPYVKATATLGLSAIRVKDGQGNITTVHDLKGTGATYNEIDVEEKKYINRMSIVNLGTLTWSKQNNNKCSVATLPSDAMVEASANSNTFEATCQGYVKTTANAAYAATTNMTFGINQLGGIYIANTAFDNLTGAQVATALNGVYLLYPLAEPVIYDLVDDMPDYSQVWGVGTENILPEGVDENGVPKTTPLRAVIYYPKDYTSTINNLPKNYISKESLTNMLNALKSAGVITSFTMTWIAETQTYNFTIS